MMPKLTTLFVLITLFATLPLTGRSQTFDDLVASAQQAMDTWNHDEAIVFYDQALALDQTHPRSYFMRGTARRETGDHDGALQDLDQALELAPDEPEFLYERGTLRYYVQDYLGAVEDFDRFLGIDPSMATILQLRGESKFQLADHAGAAADYTAVLEMTPDNPEIYYLRGFARAELADWAGSVADFTVVMDMPPLDGMGYDKRDAALLRRANVKLRAGDHEGAQGDCDLAIERDEHDLEAYFIRAQARVAMEQFGGAVADLDVVIERYPLPEAIHERGLARQGLGDADGAEVDFRKAAELGYEGAEGR